MKKIAIIVFAAALAVGVALGTIFSFGRLAIDAFSFDLNFGKVKGSGNVQTEKRFVDKFKAVEVGGVFAVEIVAQKDFGVEVEADDNLLPLIITETDGETLKIETEESFTSKNPVRIRISAPDIENLDVSGASKVSVSNLANESLRVDSSGASNLKIDGTTKVLKIDMSGASRLDAESLKSESAYVEASGASKATVHASSELKVDLSGASKVIYYGNPANFEKKTSGASCATGK